MTNECQNCEKKNACIPFFEHEGAMEHMKFAIRSVVMIALVFAIAITASIIIFVNSYNARTEKWLTTYAALQNRGVVTYGVQEQPSP